MKEVEKNAKYVVVILSQEAYGVLCGEGYDADPIGHIEKREHELVMILHPAPGEANRVEVSFENWWDQ